MSALGHNRTFGGAIVMSALPPKADMCDAARDVRFGPKADIAHPLCASEAILFFTSTGAAGCAEIPLVEQHRCNRQA
jgi:hypothetical protein